MVLISYMVNLPFGAEAQASAAVLVALSYTLYSRARRKSMPAFCLTKRQAAELRPGDLRGEDLEDAVLEHLPKGRVPLESRLLGVGTGACARPPTSLVLPTGTIARLPIFS